MKLNILVAAALGAIIHHSYLKLKAQSTEFDEAVERVQTTITGYKDGFLDGKGFYQVHHQVNHPDCGRCPVH